MQLIGHHVKPKLTLLLLDFNKNWSVDKC
jgi:hypothetical protein